MGVTNHTGRHSRTWRPSPPKRRIAATAVLAVVVALALLAAAAPDARAHVSSGRRVVIVIIDRIGLDDLSEADSPNVMDLISGGGFALMNARSRYDLYGLGGYVSIGAGGRALGGPNAGLAFNSTELLETPSGESVEAGDLYRARTGADAPAGSVVNLYIEEMKERSDTDLATSLPGLLGEAVREGGGAMALVGNADSLAPANQVVTGYQVGIVQTVETTPGSAPQATLLHREASCIAMDSDGLVPSGDVSSDLYTADPASAPGVRTDFAKLIDEATARLATSDLLVVDMGQTSRVDEQAGYSSAETLARARAAALRECDAALGKLVERIDTTRDLLVVCTPTPTREMVADGDLLTPLVVTGPGFTAGRRLGSPTTRRVGLVSNYDIAPTALEFLGLEIPGEMDGRALAASSTGTDLEGMRSFEERATAASSARKTMVRVYVIVSMVLISLFLLLALIRVDILARRRLLWSLVLFSILAGPLAYLAVPAFAVPETAWLIPAVLVASVLLALGALALRPGGLRSGPRALELAPLASPLAALSGVTLLTILLDIAVGSPLMTFSAFGSDVVIADRYYGIGNLYMGFATGSAILFACLLVTLMCRSLDSPWKRYTAFGLVLAVTAFFVGFGRLGANFGGLVTVVAGGTVAAVQLEGGRLGLKKLALVAAVLVLFLAVMVGADVLLPGTSSHTGKAFSGAGGNTASEFVSLVSRKLAATWSLTFASIWRLLALLLVIGGLALNWRFHLFGRIKGELPRLSAGFFGMGVAMAVAWVVNDSGIEAVAGISVFLFVPFFLLLTAALRSGGGAEGG